jgi:hypothetical protein
MIECAAKLLIPSRIDNREYGRTLFDLISRYSPQHLPEKYDCEEPLRRKFRMDGMETVLDEWGKLHFMASGENVFLHVNFSPRSTPKPRHTSISFLKYRVESEDQLEALKELAVAISQAFDADYGMAHILTSEELEARLARKLQKPTSWPEPPVEQIVDGLRQKARVKGFASVLLNIEIIGLSTVQLRKCLPNLYWLNIFGKPYVNLFGFEKLYSTNCEKVSTLPYGGVALTLSQGIADTAEGWQEFEQIREKCKCHLGADFFPDSSLPSSQKCCTPEFGFPS